MAPDIQFKVMNAIHKSLLKVSFGKFGWSALGMPVVELTTIGRKSGEPRTTMLTTPWQEDTSTIIVASRGGDDKHPAWFLNLQANPSVEVRIGGGAQQQMRARVAEGDERTRLWDSLTAAHQNYADYQSGTDRLIPVVVLEPVADAV